MWRMEQTEKPVFASIYAFTCYYINNLSEQITNINKLISLNSLRPLYLPCFKAKFPLQISLLWDKKKSYLILCYDDIFWLESGYTHCLCDSGITILLVVKLIPSWVGRRDEGAEVRSKAVSKLWLLCQKRQFLHRSGQEGRKQSTDFFLSVTCRAASVIAAGCRSSLFDTADRTQVLVTTSKVAVLCHSLIRLDVI